MGNVDFVIPYTAGEGSEDTSVDVTHEIKKFA